MASTSDTAFPVSIRTAVYITLSSFACAVLGTFAAGALVAVRAGLLPAVVRPVATGVLASSILVILFVSVGVSAGYFAMFVRHATLPPSLDD